MANPKTCKCGVHDERVAAQEEKVREREMGKTGRKEKRAGIGGENGRRCMNFLIDGAILNVVSNYTTIKHDNYKMDRNETYIQRAAVRFECQSRKQN